MGSQGNRRYLEILMRVPVFATSCVGSACPCLSAISWPVYHLLSTQSGILPKSEFGGVFLGLKNYRSSENLGVVIGPVVLRIGVALSRLVSKVHLKTMCVVMVIPAQMAESP